ncbi:hypothetical protein ABE504_23790 [Paenibacillus oryzisoli]|uniref:hypothetical protein n=1 Tax=Paenibacillus oryzisoli TaxID=1850517 RepID=UPI003D2E15B4
MSKSRRKKSEEELLSEAILKGTLTNEYGEPTKVLITLDDGDKRIISKVAEKKRREQARRFFQSDSPDSRGNFIQLIHEANDQLHKRSTIIETKKDKWTLLHDKYVMMLIPFADRTRKGLLVDIETRNPLNGADIAKRLNVTINAVQPILKALVKHGALLEVKAPKNQKHYQFNDDIFNMKGRSLLKDEHFTKIFQLTLSQILEKLSGNEIGLLRVLASRFHYQSYYLVDNPDIDLRQDKSLSFQQNFEKHGSALFEGLTFLSMSEIMRLAEIQHSNTLLDYMYRLRDAGAIHINERSNGLRGKKKRVKRFIRVNPNLMYRERGNLDQLLVKFMLADFDLFKFKGGEDQF